MNIFIDTDVLVIRFIYRTDPRFTVAKSLMELKKLYTSIYNVLELYGVACAAGLPGLADKLFRKLHIVRNMVILYPLVVEPSPELYLSRKVRELMDVMKRGLRYGDSKVLWIAEQHDVDILATWNIKHFKEKTKINVLKPEEVLTKYT